MKMDEIAAALAPIFIASFALQQLLELLSPLLDTVIKRHKKWILSAVAFVVGLGMSLGLNLRILFALGVPVVPWVDILMTALFITGSTKGINDLVKVLAYKKTEVRTRLSDSQVVEA
jgi:hypothetical protein